MSPYLLTLLAIVILSKFSKGQCKLTEDEYKLLPLVYQMASYEQCTKNIGNMYCIVHLTLRPTNSSTRIWKYIEKTKHDDFVYDRDEIYRTVCIPENIEANDYVKTLIDKEIKEINLTSRVDRVSCKNAIEPNMFILYTMILYLCFIIFATFLDYIDFARLGVIKAFSLISNYRKLFERRRNIHYQNLKCIQGLRTICCMALIVTHTCVALMLSFVEDTDALERIYSTTFYTILSYNFFLPQVFSVISAWLLTVQVLDLFESKKEFTLKDALIIGMNRMFRFWPALLFFILLIRPSAIGFIKTGVISEVTDATALGCEKYYWYSLLFIQNFFKPIHMCNVGFWFISADMQMHVFCLVVLYIAVRCRSTKVVLGASMVASSLVFGMVIYLKDLDVVFRTNPETLKWYDVFQDSNLVLLHQMPYVYMNTYILGVCFGMYYHNRCRNEKRQKLSIIWPIFSYGLTVLAILVLLKKFSGVYAAIFGPLIRVVFGCGVGLFILGEVQSKESVTKRILEWRPLEFLSQFTYVVYITHFVLVFSRTITDRPLEISYFIVAKAFIFDTSFGFLIGFVMHLLVELPWQNVLGMVLPRIEKKSKKATE